MKTIIPKDIYNWFHKKFLSNKGKYIFDNNYHEIMEFQL